MDKIELWEWIPDYEAMYKASNLGEVMRMAGRIQLANGHTKWVNEKVLKQGTDGRGYPTVSLSKKGIIKKKSVHSLVAEAFLNHKANNGLIVDHKDNIKTNNHADNLQLITQRENSSKDRVSSNDGFTGVTWYNPTSKWIARIQIGGQRKQLGSFDNKEDAINSYQDKLKEIKCKIEDIKLLSKGIVINRSNI